MMSDDFDYSEFIGQFVEEAREHLQNLNTCLLALENFPEKTDVLDEIAREAHTLKGTARMLDATEIATVSHKLEDLFEEVKDGKLKLDITLCDLLFESLDSLGSLLESFAAQEKPNLDVEDLVNRIEEARTSKIRGARQSKKGRPKKKKKETDKEASLATISDETIRVSSTKLDSLVNLTGEMVVNKIRMSDREKNIKLLIELLRDQSRHWKRLKDEIGRLEVNGPLQSDVDLMESERLNIETELYTLARQWREDVSSTDLLVSQLQQEVLDVRMRPISTVFDTFRRPVRDLANQFGKEVDLIISGEATEIDKKVIEGINDPLVHVLRNAIDHGIETPDNRQKKGKDRRAKLTVGAHQEGEYVVIEISDDGAGVDIEKVRKKATANKLITEEEASKLNESSLLQLLFRPGFSTKDKVSQISGRGVGMDVVKKKVEELKGMTYIKTGKDVGTTVVIKVPLTMALTRILFIVLSGYVFGVQTANIEEIIRIKSSDIKTIENRQVVIIRDHAVPLIKLNRILRITDERNRGSEMVIPVLIANIADNRIGFVVDNVVNEQEVLIKPLGEGLKEVEYINGATILSSGEIVLILNTVDLMTSAKGMGDKPDASKKDADKKLSKRILVVDDSLSAREVEKNILTSAGYDVDVALDGQDALDKVHDNAYNLLVVDVQMPRLDGFSLTRRLKSDDRYKDIPIVIVTTQGSKEDRDKGIKAGADAYIVKKAFDQAHLLKTIDGLIG